MLKRTGYYGFTLCDCKGGKKNVLVHRFVWEYFNGPIPKGLVVDHINSDRKDNRLVNLQVITMSENNRKGRATKITAEIAEEVRAMCAKGHSQSSVAALFGISQPTVSNIVTNILWK